MAKQNPTDQNNIFQLQQLNLAPRERRMNVVSEYVTIYGEAPSGAHEAEPRWSIWRETKDDSGRITVDYAQDGSNTLYWIYNTIAFNPVVDLSGNPYFIELDNNVVYDGMGAGLPVANISVFDVDDITHNLQITFDPYSKFTLVGNVLTLADTVQLIDIAYPVKIKATDDDGNSYDQVFAVYVQDPTPPAAGEFVGELNLFEEDAAVPTLTEVSVLTYTVPVARGLRISLIEVFGTNLGKFTVEIDGNVAAKKHTYYTSYETEFDFANYELTAGQTIIIKAENKGKTTACFNARLRGYQYAV